MPSVCNGTCRRLFVTFVALQICLAAQAFAQDATRSVPSPPSQTLTGKERLGRKWMDEQRIDNCNVPVDKRGSKPRPGVCPHVPTG
ncbi:hypothetical protein ES703_63190 [subsurface metagenome]|jgi:hypothetical protein